jgi:hypothetical protein
MKDEVINGQRIRCYDSGGSFDRYTVAYMQKEDWGYKDSPFYPMRGMSANPFHPLGFGQMCHGTPGRHLGKRIAFADLPEDCRKLVEQDTKEGE